MDASVARYFTVLFRAEDPNLLLILDVLSLHDLVNNLGLHYQLHGPLNCTYFIPHWAY